MLVFSFADKGHGFGQPATLMSVFGAAPLDGLCGTMNSLRLSFFLYSIHELIHPPNSVQVPRAVGQSGIVIRELMCFTLHVAATCSPGFMGCQHFWRKLGEHWAKGGPTSAVHSSSYWFNIAVL